MKRRWITTCVLSVSMGLSTLLSPAGAYAFDPPPDAVKEATNQFNKGFELFKARKYALALDAFQSSYGAVASPNSHLYIARCFNLLGQARAAYAEFQKVIKEAAGKPKYADTAETARTERDELAPKLGLLVVLVGTPRPDARISVSGNDVPQGDWLTPIPVNPGDVSIVYSAGGGAPPETQTVTIAASERKEAAFGRVTSATASVTASTTNASSQRSKLNVATYTAAGVGVVGLGVFTVAGLMTRSAYNALQTECAGPCPSSRQSDIDAGRHKQIIANVGLGVGLAGVATSAVLFVLGPKSAATTSAVEHLEFGTNYVGVRGSF